MIKLIYCMLLAICSVKLQAQSFSGVLKYGIDIEFGRGVKGVVNQLRVDGNIPYDTISYFYSSDGAYYSEHDYMNKSYLRVFDKEQKRLYNLYKEDSVAIGLDVMLTNRSAKQKRPVLKLHQDSVIEINGYQCNIIDVIWDEGIYTYYFKENMLTINPDFYKDYNYEGWYDYLKISKSLPVRIEKDIDGLYKINFTLIGYKEGDIYIENSKLKLPKLIEIKELNGVYPNKKIYDIEY